MRLFMAACGTLLVIACFSAADTASAGSCPFTKKKNAAGSVQKTGTPQYQTAESVSKKYGLTNKGMSSRKSAKVQTAEEVLKKIELDKREQEKSRADATKKAPPSSRSPVPSARTGRSRESRAPALNPAPSRKTKPLPASPAAQQALQGLAGQGQGYAIDLSVPPPGQPASAE